MIGWVLSGLTILGAILNIRKNKWGFIAWIVSNVGWVYLNLTIGLYEQIPVWVVLTVLSIIGFTQWSKEGD